MSQFLIFSGSENLRRLLIPVTQGQLARRVNRATLTLLEALSNPRRITFG